jgi:hypothetical protein
VRRSVFSRPARSYSIVPARLNRPLRICSSRGAAHPAPCAHCEGPSRLIHVDLLSYRDARNVENDGLFSAAYQSRPIVDSAHYLYMDSTMHPFPHPFLHLPAGASLSPPPFSLSQCRSFSNLSRGRPRNVSLTPSQFNFSHRGFFPSFPPTPFKTLAFSTMTTPHW